jgi:hypothetical protein
MKRFTASFINLPLPFSLRSLIEWLRLWRAAVGACRLLVSRRNASSGRRLSVPVIGLSPVSLPAHRLGAWV